MPLRSPIRKRFDWYVSGPISSYGNQPENIQRFHDAARALRDKGYRIFNPAEHEPEGLTWEQYLEMDIVGLVASKGVATLPYWNRSKGSRLEVTIGKRLNMPVRAVEEILSDDRLVG